MRLLVLLLLFTAIAASRADAILFSTQGTPVSTGFLTYVTNGKITLLGGGSMLCIHTTCN